MIQAAVTMNQLQQKLDLIGSNMANVQTTGYKNRQTEFSSLLFQHMNNLSDEANMEGRLTPEGIRAGSGARLGAININLTQGSIIETDRSLDTALIDPNTFYQIQVTEGNTTETRYTRDGAFYLSPINNDTDVMLTTSEGHPVLGRDGTPIVFAAGFDEVQVQSNGEIIVQRGGVPETAGQLGVVTAVRPRILEATGENTFRLPDLAELGMTEAEIIQETIQNADVLKSNALEQSNVDLADQMSELLLTQRSYQFNARTISMGDQMMGLVNQLR